MRAPRPVAGLLLVVAAAAAFALAGCAPSGADANASPVAASAVDLPPSYKFAPAAIRVAAGSTVTWTNNDHFTHSVQFLGGGLPADPLVMDPGQAVTFTFDTPGTYPYQCHLHPQNMTGSVTVGP
jgi:plastocyanin